MSGNKHSMHDETLWVERAKQGDQKAFKTLYEAHVEPLYRFMKQFSQGTEEVEEWVQRRFIKAFEHLPTFDGQARFSTWLFKLALNEMRMDRRRATLVSFVRSNDDDHLSPELEPDNFEWRETMKTWRD